MFSLPPALQNLPASRRFLVFFPLPLAIAGVLAWPQDREAPLFPPVPAVTERTADNPERKPSSSRKPILPRRDPFRPLNQPAIKKAIQGPQTTPGNKVSQPQAPTVPATPHRLLGILTVKGEQRALVSGPRGTAMYALGEILPGKGPVTAFHSSSLECDGQELPVGEVWQ